MNRTQLIFTSVLVKREHELKNCLLTSLNLVKVENEQYQELEKELTHAQEKEVIRLLRSELWKCLIYASKQLKKASSAEDYGSFSFYNGILTRFEKLDLYDLDGYGHTWNINGLNLCGVIQLIKGLKMVQSIHERLN